MIAASCPANVPRATDLILRTIAEGTAGATGAEFFRDLVRLLAQATGFRTAFVSEFFAENRSAKVLAIWDKERYLAPFEYAIKGTPCETALDGKVSFIAANVAVLFPDDREWLDELGADSYLAIPIKDRSGAVLGHLAALHDQTMAGPGCELSIFEIFGARAAAELERERMQQALHASERRLASVLANAMDAILIIDAAHHITLFNRAAEAIFRCSAVWAIGQPIERFIARRNRNALDQYLSGSDARALRQLWAPEGLFALRADGEEFPIEATVSPLNVGSEPLFTFILRDVNDRERALAGLLQLQTEHANLQEELQRREDIDRMVATAPCMQTLLGVLQQVARADIAVLITGETGTGKERIARAIHRASPRAGHALVPVNCAALPSELIESELFGHEKGAFTGATALRRGRFELAHQGSIFLDEVGELSLPAQAKLLRVLQEQEFERVGGGRPIKVDVRVIAATNRDLQQMVAAGLFRSDLYYRLNVFPLQVPPLRERREDIAPLALYFLERVGRKLGREFCGLLPASLERLQRYAWPGNIRELQNVIERTAIVATGPLIEVRDPLLDAIAEPDPAPLDPATPSSAAADDVLRAHIERILRECGGTIEGPRGAATLLGLRPSTLRHRMKQLGIGKPSAHPTS